MCSMYLSGSLWGGSILPTEEPHFSRKQIADNFRLGCQVKVKEDMEIEVEEEIMGIKSGKLLWFLIIMWLLTLKNLLWRFLRIWITKQVGTFK